MGIGRQIEDRMVIPEQFGGGGVTLDSTTRKLQAYLGEGISTSNPTFVVSYFDVSGTTVTSYTATGALNGVTPVDLVAAPALNVQRYITEINIYNADTITHAIFVRLLDNATPYVIEQASVPAGYTLRYSPANGWQVGSVLGPGTVTSVALALPASILTVSGSPVTTAGTLTGTLATQAANLVWAGPITGAAAAPTFRSLVAGDIPSLTGTYLPLAGGTMAGAIGLANGSASAPELAFNTNYGLFYDTVNGGIGFSVAGVQSGFMAANAFTWQVIGGGAAIFMVAAEGTQSFRGLRADASANGPAVNMRKSRGTIAAPTVILGSDTLGTNTYTGWDGAAFTTSLTQRIRCIEVTPGPAALGTQFQMLSCPVGSASQVDLFYADATNGLNVGGASGGVFIDMNRILRPRLYTVGTLPAVTATGLVDVSDEAGRQTDLYADGTAWRRKGDNQVASTTVDYRGVWSALSVRGSTTLLTAIQAAYQKLSDAGLLAKLKGLCVHAMPNSSDALIDWITPGTKWAAVGSPVFTANRGFTGDGVGAYIDSGKSQATWGAGQSDVAVGTYVLTGSVVAANVIGKVTANQDLWLQSATSGVLTVRCQDLTNDNWTPARYTGLFVLSRTGAANYQPYLDDIASGAVITRASNTPAVGTVAFLASPSGSSFSTAQIAYSFIASGLSAADVSNLSAIMGQFLQTVGAITYSVSHLPPAANFSNNSIPVPDLGGGAGNLRSNAVNWLREDAQGYQADATTTGTVTLVPLTNARSYEFTGALTGNMTVRLKDIDAKGTACAVGERFLVTRAGAGAFTMTVVDDTSGATLKVYASLTPSAGVFAFNGTAWRLAMDAAL